MKRDYLPKITEHTHFHFCWVCGPDTQLKTKHSHHVVPRAFGGVDGPTVTICTHHHGLIHKVADACWKSKKHHLIIGMLLAAGETQESVDYSRYLVEVIIRSRIAHQNDPNKHSGFGMSFDPNTAKMIDEIKSNLSLRSKQDVIVSAIHSFHHQLFGKSN